MPFQLFVSYSRNDNIRPTVGAGKGFVSEFLQRFEAQFTDMGSSALRLFYDETEISKHERFGDKISEALTGADALVVIFSSNWLGSKNCRDELDAFVRARQVQGLDEAAIAKSIFIVCKRHVEFEEWPEILRGSEGYRFYSLAPGRGAGDEDVFFDNGRVIDEDRYTARLREVTRDLWKFSKQPRPANVAISTNSRARYVYLAKSAADFTYAYDRLYHELVGKEYTVVPDRGTEIPLKSGAAAFISAELQKAEASIHVLGQSHGPITDATDPLVALQLKLATAEALRRKSGPAAAPSSFERLVWAPRFVVDADGIRLSRDERDPIATLREFEGIRDDEPLPAGEVDGNDLTEFCDIVLRHLVERTPQEKLDFETTDGQKVFLLHLEEDWSYALQVGDALTQLKLTVVPRQTDGPANEVEAANLNLLHECDIVVACWADAYEVRVMAQLQKFADASFAATKKFKLTGLVIGPEPKPAKLAQLRFAPKRVVDRALDLTQRPSVTSTDLEPLFRPSP